MMTVIGTGGETVRFKGWEIRPQERCLLVGGKSVKLGGRAFALLLTLVEHHGRVVSKEALMAAVWPGRFVEENNISVHMHALRNALPPGTISNVAGHGYQLAAVPLRSAPVVQSSLLGRSQDLEQVLTLMADGALVTLAGTGGVGKTALAREACARAGGDQVWIDLALVREPRQAVALIAESLRVELGGQADPVEPLVAALGHAGGLVVMDNCEHVLEVVRTVVSAALERAPGLRWLATSRAPLELERERVWRLAPLAIPMNEIGADEVLQFGAVALLCRRVAEAGKPLDLDNPEVLASAVDLCAKLDGLPLALEMAASRIAGLVQDEVRRLLGQRLKLLSSRGRRSGHRHDTLQATYDWSYDLLEENEKAVFRRLEPFLGGFDGELAQQVARDDEDGGPINPFQVMSVLGALVDKSLVQRGPEPDVRFYLLESAREYARGCLQAAGEEHDVGARHARAVARRLADAARHAASMNDAAWIRRYVPERHNALAALARCREDGDADNLARLVTALCMMDWILCREAEILQSAVPLDLLSQADKPLRAQAFLDLSWANFSDGDHRLGADLSRRAFSLFEELELKEPAYRALAQLARLLETQPGMAQDALDAWDRMQRLRDVPLPARTRLFCAVSAGLVNRPELTVEFLRELEQQAAQHGFDAIAAICGCNLTNRLLEIGRDEDVVSEADRLLEVHAHANRACAFMLHNKTTALIRLGHYDQAYEAASLAFRAMPAVAHFLVDAFALGAAREGRMVDAAVLYGCGANAREVLHELPDLPEAACIAETAARLEAHMTEMERREWMALGAAMTAGDALAIKVFPRRAPPRARAAAPASVPDPSF
jgi:predicted ATPase